MSISINPDLDTITCAECGYFKFACICKLKLVHREDCRFLRAARLTVELACDHGFQACPICDPCSCGVEVEGIR